MPAVGFGGLNWDTKTIELTAKPGDKQVIGAFRFRNLGSTTIKITEVETSCGCTSAELTMNPGIQYLLDQGCIGFYKIVARKVVSPTASRYPGFRGLPEEETNPIFGEQKAFLTLAAANAYSCGTGTRKVIAAKFGRWKNGNPPQPAGDGTVDPTSIIDWSADHNYDYFVYMPDNGKWINMNNGYNPDNPSQLPTQEMREWDTLPLSSLYHGPIFLVRCIPDYVPPQ